MQMSIVNKKSDTIMAKVQLPELLGGGGGGATLFWQYQHFGAPVIPLKINPPLDERALILIIVASVAVRFNGHFEFHIMDVGCNLTTFCCTSVGTFTF